MLKTYVITGGTSGLGKNSAVELAQMDGASVVITGRDDAQARDVAASVGANVTGMGLDLGSQASIRAFVDQLRRLGLTPIHGLVCNAGVTLHGPTRHTEEGVELTFGVNHLGHHLLSRLLADDFAPGGRVIIMSSGTHIPDHTLARRTGTPVPQYTSAEALAHPTDQKGGPRVQGLRYTTSKLCNVLHAYAFDRRWKAEGRPPLNVFAMDPGLMPDTGLAREFPKVLAWLFMGAVRLLRPFVKGIRLSTQSAVDVRYLLTSPDLRDASGVYFDGRSQVPSSPVSYDADKQHDLWVTSSRLCGLESGTLKGDADAEASATRQAS